MKKLIAFITIGLALTACKGNAEKEQEKQAEIQSAMNAAIDSVNDINARERAIDSMNQAQQSVNTEVESTAPAPAHRSGTHKHPSATPEKTDKTATNETVAPGTATASPGNDKTGTAPETKKDEPVATEEKKKKGMSNAAKGAIIGAGAGAVGGAIINKENRGKGAIIGGAVGAGAGAVTGVILDKRKKKKEAEKADTLSTETTGKEPAPKK